MRFPPAPAVLLCASLLVSYAALRFCAARPPEASSPAGAAAHLAAAEVEILRGTLELANGARVEARVAPLHASGELEAFRSRALRELLGLPEGAPWTLRLSAPRGAELPASTEAELRAARVLDEDGEAIVPLAERLAGAPSTGRAEPWRALFKRAAAAPDSAVHWGRLAGAGARLELTVAGEKRSIPLERARIPAAELAEWVARAEAVAVADAATADARVAELETELEAERSRRQASETALLEYQRLLGRIESGGAREIAGRPPPPAPPAEEEPVDPALAAARARAAEIARSLSALLRIEGLRGVDLLEVGTLGAGSIGPVAFRLLDDRGRLIGGLFAERLRLEASRSAKTVTVVLEDGCETAGETRTPFEGGTRRIPLVHVDPEPWFEALPELFAADVLDSPDDDGFWDHSRLRGELNRLLGLDGSAGFYRVHSFEGVLGDELVDVHLEEFDARGALERRYFADRLRIAFDPPGISLLLRDGAVVVGDSKEPFREGRHRIYLPRAPLDAWRAAQLPGLARAAAANETAGATPAPN